MVPTTAELTEPVVDDDGTGAGDRNGGHPRRGAGAALDLTSPGNEDCQRIIRTVKADLAGWRLHQLVWLADRGFAPAANRGYLT